VRAHTAHFVFFVEAFLFLFLFLFFDFCAAADAAVVVVVGAGRFSRCETPSSKKNPVTLKMTILKSPPLAIRPTCCRCLLGCLRSSCGLFSNLALLFELEPSSIRTCALSLRGLLDAGER
jgi:hypothetical protein